jgi:glycosyltransferase involved in cell wall biosynthesis
MYKVVHIVQGKVNIDRPNGVNAVIYGLSTFLVDKVDLIVIGISKGTNPGKKIRRNKFEVILFPNTKLALDYFKTLENVGIVHLHSVWQWTNYIFGRFLIRNSVPYVITLHSGLSPDRVRKSKFIIRKIYHAFFQKFILDGASFIQALTNEESTDIVGWTSNRRVKVISNGVANLESYNYRTRENDKLITLGYLGRFGQEKNISSLLDALAILPNELKEDLKIELIGPMNEEYQRLIRKVKFLGLDDLVVFHGSLFGKEKYNTMKRWSGYIHVAYSDVVSIAVMEALSIGLPAIIARTCHMSYFFKSNGFIMVEPHAVSIASGIEHFVNSRESWPDMSSHARALALESFNWERVGLQLFNEYSKIV